MNQPAYKEKIGTYALVMIAVGACVGAGIFATPAQIVRELPHHGWVLLVWVIGGLITLTGALTFGELGALFPKSGGVYVYLREAYGDIIAFSYGWIILLVINTGSMAALGLAFAEYMTYFVPMSGVAKIVLGAVLILGLTGLNILGVDVGRRLISIATSMKLLAIMMIVLVAIFAQNFSAAEFNPSLGHNVPDNLGGAILLALIGVLWSFGGWHHASYLAGETKNPQKTLPKAMVIGAIIVTITYVAVNWAYMNMLPLNQIANSQRVAVDIFTMLGRTGSLAITIIVGLSIFGTIAIYTMSAPRIYQAMAADGVFFKKLSVIHPKYRTPANAMIFQALWAVILLVFWGTFHDLITYVAFADLSFMLLGGLALFVFRRRGLNQSTFKVPLYPIIPLLFILTTGAFVLNTLIQRPWQSGAGLLLLALGLPIYFYFKRRG